MRRSDASRWLRAAPLAWLMWAGLTVEVRAEVPAIFKDAELPLGEKLIAEHQCSSCHARRVGGDGSDIYNPQGRINQPGLLRGMVESCNTQLNMGMFPEEVTAIAAVLNRDHYRFKSSAPNASARKQP